MKLTSRILSLLQFSISKKHVINSEYKTVHLLEIQMFLETFDYILLYKRNLKESHLLSMIILSFLDAITYLDWGYESKKMES